MPMLLTIYLAILPFLYSQKLTPEQERGKDLFKGCQSCHNVRTDARRAGPSLRTLFGKVRMGNGKRAIEDNVRQIIAEGYNGMPSYRYTFREDDWTDLLAYLKTLRSRPEIGAVLKPIRGADDEILASGKALHAEHCGSCHDGPGAKAPALLGIYTRESLANGDPVSEAPIIARIREGHGGMAKNEGLDDGALFRLMAFLKVQ